MCILNFYLFIFSCAGSLLLHWLFSSCGEWRTLRCSVRASHCSGFSCCRAQAVGCRGFRSCSSLALMLRLIVAVHELSCSTAYGIFPDRGSNPCLLYWQEDSVPLSHQISPGQGVLTPIQFFLDCSQHHSNSESSLSLLSG